MIALALQEMDQLIVVVYDDPITTTTLKVRAAWIRNLYPTAKVIEGHNAPTDAGYTPKIMQIQKYLYQQLKFAKILFNTDHLFTL